MNLPAQATKDFITSHPGWKAMYQGERLVALYGGPGIANQTTSEKAAFVESFAQSERPAFGITDSQLALENIVPLGNADKTVYTYRQEIDGVPVHGSRIKVIAQGADGGTISYIGLRVVPGPYPQFPADLLTAQQATAAVANNSFYAGVNTFNTPVKVIVETADGSLHRVWRFGGWGGAHNRQFFVDTNTGRIVGSVSADLDDISGQVRGKHTTPDFAPYTNNNPNLSALVGLPGAMVTIGDGTCSSGNVTASQYTCPDPMDQPPSCVDGTYAFTGVSTPGHVSTTLDGRWVRVRSCECCAECGGNQASVGKRRCAVAAANDECDVWRQCQGTPTGYLDF